MPTKPFLLTLAETLAVINKHEMTRLTLTFIITMYFNVTLAQKSDTITYYKNEYCNKEVTKKKAKYSKEIRTNPDGSITTEILELSSSKIYSSNSLKGEEPVGIWHINGADTTFQVNYNFAVNYNRTACVPDEKQDFAKGDLFDDPSKSYNAPVITNSKWNLFTHILMSGYYLNTQKQGKVIVAFEITSEGKINNIRIIEGVSPALDKETVRIIREIELSSPPLLNGKAFNLCTVFGKLFKLN